MGGDQGGWGGWGSETDVKIVPAIISLTSKNKTEGYHWVCDEGMVNIRVRLRVGVSQINCCWTKCHAIGGMWVWVGWGCVPLGRGDVVGEDEFGSETARIKI